MNQERNNMKLVWLLVFDRTAMPPYGGICKRWRINIGVTLFSCIKREAVQQKEPRCCAHWCCASWCPMQRQLLIRRAARIKRLRAWWVTSGVAAVLLLTYLLTNWLTGRNQRWRWAKFDRRLAAVSISSQLVTDRLPACISWHCSRRGMAIKMDGDVYDNNSFISCCRQFDELVCTVF